MPTRKEVFCKDPDIDGIQEEGVLPCDNGIFVRGVINIGLATSSSTQ
jgi:hypothetical protein